MGCSSVSSNLNDGCNARRWIVTEPQRHKLVASGAVTVVGCLILYGILFGFRSLDPKSLLLLIGFFVVAAKISTVKHKHNPMI